jgi:hypothetical protein
MTKKTLIVTNSKDATVDIIVSVLGSDNIFRLNYDLWDTYNFEFNSSGFKISNKYHDISNLTMAKGYWRKPFAFPFSREFPYDLKEYYTEELKYILRELFAYCKLQKKAILVNPSNFNIYGKVHQKMLAKKYFLVPDFQIFWNQLPKFRSSFTVAKTLSSSLIGNKFLYTTKVETASLDLTLPWFIENGIKAQKDLTIVYVAGNCFAYTLKRDITTNAIDWRTNISSQQQNWETYKLSKKFSDKVKLFMKEINLKFGRLDFLISDNKYYFLEINLNGQWAWLDINNSNGLLENICSIIDPTKPLLKKHLV